MFNGPYEKCIQLKENLQEADFIFLSGHKEIPRKMKPKKSGAFIYNVGENGRSIVSLKINIGHVDSSLNDISMLLEREKFIYETLDFLHGGASISVEEMYSGNHNMAQKIKRIKLELQAARKELENTVNSIEFDFIPLSDMVTEDQKINSIINEAHNRPN